MIRYVCPHCQRVCESADVLRGFGVICLGCRQPVRVPDESTVADEVAAASPLPRPSPPPPSPPERTPPPASPLVEFEPPDVIPPQPVVIPPPPAAVRRPLAAASPQPPKPKPAVPHASNDPASRRRVIRLGLLGLLAVVLLLGGGVGYRWYSKRKARKQDAGQNAELDQRKDLARANFSRAALKRLGEKVPKWDIAPIDLPKLKGKVVVLSVSDAPDQPPSFWRDLGSRWPLSVDDGQLIKDLFERGLVDDLTFALPEYRWAEGPGEAGTIIGVRWRREVGGVFADDKLIEIDPGLLRPESVKSTPVAIRIAATVIVLDFAANRLVGRRTFVGPLPKSKPAAGKNDIAGLRPADDITQWLQRLDTGR